MPNLQTFNSAPRLKRRYEVKATGETGAALSGTPGGMSVGRQVTIGPDQNVRVIDICLDETGEIRTYRAEYVEEIAE